MRDGGKNIIPLSTAIILAGGLGTRLKSITKDLVPKPMVHVQGYPFLHWQMRYLKSQNIKKVILAVSHHAKVIQDYFKDRYLNIPVFYSDENKPLGTGGAIARAMQMVEEKSSVILNGDTYFPVDLTKLRQSHSRSKNDISIAVKLMYKFDRYGTVEMDDTHRITDFNEKAYTDKGYINGGTYIINKSVFVDYNADSPFSLEKEIFEQKVKNLKIGAFRSKAGFIDIGIPEEYERIQSMRLK